MPRVVLKSSFDGRPDQAVEALPGETVLQAFLREHQPLANSCQGEHTCGKCRIHVVEGPARDASAAERKLLDRLRLGADMRLACGLVPEGDLTVRLDYR